jgi:hypothetical protein
MNAILKGILLGAEKAAVTFVPEAAAVDTAARAILSASTGAETGDAVFQTAVAGLSLVENDFGVQFANEPDFQGGLYMAKAGFTQMAKAIAAHKAAPQGVPPAVK